MKPYKRMTPEELLESRRKATKKQGDFLRGKTFDEIHGVERSAEIRAKLSAAQLARPDRHNPKPNRLRGKGGSTRYGARYTDFQEAVRIHYGFECVDCASTDRLCVHHIKPWKDYPELRFDIDNCLLLCRSCHCKQESAERWKDRKEKGIIGRLGT